MCENKKSLNSFEWNILIENLDTNFSIQVFRTSSQFFTPDLTQKLLASLENNTLEVLCFENCHLFHKQNFPDLPNQEARSNESNKSHSSSFRLSWVNRQTDVRFCFCFLVQIRN